MYKIAYNDCFGAYELSEIAVERIIEIRKERNLTIFDYMKVENMPNVLNGSREWIRALEVSDRLPRYDPILIEVIEELGEKASTATSDIKIFSSEYPVIRIKDYDGKETCLPLPIFDNEIISVPLELTLDK